jgi:outer membrane protein OmpA-like peptidoglycan-associated protein
MLKVAGNMVARFRHAIRIGTGLVAVGLLAACGREATRAEAAGPRASLPALLPGPAPDIPIRAELAWTVYFDYRSPSLTPRARRVLDKWVAFLKVHHGLVVSLTGHTDSSGPRQENLALGRQRAAAVRRALVRGGIAGQRVHVNSRGEDEPQVYGTDEFAASRNRRVEFEIN